MLWRFAIQPKSVHTAQTSPLSSCVSSSRTGQSRPALGLEVMNWVPSGGLPNTSSVEGRSLMPASAASLDWSISEKNLMPLLAISALMRAIASAIGTALLTRTMPSSLSARASEATETTRNSISSDMPKLAKRWVKRRVMERLLLLGRMPSAWLPVQDDRWNELDEMRSRSQLDSHRLSAFDTPRLSNRLGNGISNVEASPLK